MSKSPVVLCVLDGWGYREATNHNAVAQANTPNFDRLWAQGPRALLDTSGEDVGLPDGQIGNSEVGHMNIGAGRVVYQDLPRIDRAISTGELPANAVLANFIAKLLASGGTAHVTGLTSPGGVHAHERHALALIKHIAAAGVPVIAHAITDGRDVAPRAAATDLPPWAEAVSAIDGASVGTVIGRYYAMDRDKRWERVQQAYDLWCDGTGAAAADAGAAVVAAHTADIGDEFVPATVLPGYPGMRDCDGLLFTNFRADRARQILHALLDDDFDGFARSRHVALAAVAGMTTYSDALADRVPALFPPLAIADGLGETVAAARLTQLRLAETEKYPHVTFFFNGGAEVELASEDRVMIPSPKVATYDLAPEMSAAGVADALVAAVDGGQHDLIVVNFANPDMVGHTGDLSAAIRAVETVDESVGRLLEALDRTGGRALLTADHGNCEEMWNTAKDCPHTAHTLNPVPLVAYPPSKIGQLTDGRLADLAPTVLGLLGVAQPAAMTGRDLTRVG